MAAPPIKDTTGRPAKELLGATADDPLAGGIGNLFDLLSRARIVAYWLAGTGVIPAGLGSGALSLTTSGNHELLGPVDSGSEPTTLEAQERHRWHTTAETNQEAGVVSAPFIFPTSETSGAPGWGLFARVTHLANGDGPRYFAGLYYPGALTNVDPTSDPGGIPGTLDDPAIQVGIRLDDGDTNYKFSYSAGGDSVSPGSRTDVDLGVAAAHGPADEQVFDLTIVCLNGVAGFRWRVVNANTGLLVGSGIVTTNAPPATHPLAFAVLGNTVAATTGVAVGVVYMVTVMEHINALIVSGPSGSVDDGGGGGGDDSPPPTDWPWHEEFTESDYAAFYAKYSDGGAIGPAPDPLTVGSDVVITGGAIEVKGNATPYQISIGLNSLTTPAREFWVKVEMEMVGGAFDTAHDPVSVFAYSDSTSLEADMTTDIFGNSSPFPYWVVVYPAFTHGATAVNRALPAGTHTFIMCLSEDSSTVQRGELWVDATAGDTPASNTTAKTSGDGFSTLTFGLFGPTDPARTLRVTDVSFIAGDRASDPFSIL